MEDFQVILRSGLSLLEKGKYLDALRELSKVEENFKGKESGEAADLFMAISQAYYGMTPKVDENSIRYSDMAYRIHSKIDDKSSMINDLAYSAYVEMDANKMPEAERRLNDAIKIAGDIKDQETFCELLTTKADLLSANKKRRKEAEQLYKEAKSTSKKNGFLPSYFESASGELKLKRMQEPADKVLKDAILLLDEAESIALEIKNKRERKAFIDDVSELYDIASDLAMELEKVDEAISLAERMTKILSK